MQDDNSTFVSKYRKYRKPLPHRPIIYLARDMRNGMAYVGQTIQPLTYRMVRHASKPGRKPSTLFDRTYRKHRDHFIYHEIEAVSDASSLNAREDYWVDIHDTIYPNGYNMRRGGQPYTPGPSPAEICKRVSDAKLAFYAETRPPEVRLRDKLIWREKWKQDRLDLWNIALTMNSPKNQHKRSCACNDVQCDLCFSVMRSRIDKLKGNPRYKRNGGYDSYNSVTDEQVLALRRMYDAGELVSVIARQFNLKEAHVRGIVTRRTKKYIPEERVIEAVTDHSHRGERNVRSKVTTAQVVEIRRRWDAGERPPTITADFPAIGASGIRHIGTRRGWKHVPEAEPAKPEKKRSFLQLLLFGE